MANQQVGHDGAILSMMSTTYIVMDMFYVTMELSYIVMDAFYVIMDVIIATTRAGRRIGVNWGNVDHTTPWRNYVRIASWRELETGRQTAKAGNQTSMSSHRKLARTG